MTLSEVEFHNLWFFIIAERMRQSPSCSFREQSLGFARDVFAKFGCEVSDDEAAREFDAYMNTYRRHWSLYADVRPCLNALADCKLGVISNGDREFQLGKLERMGIADIFRPIVLSAEIGCAKPDAAIFAEACAQVGAPASDCIYVGDHLQTDIAASTAAGWHAVWINRDEQQGQFGGVTSISTLAELLASIGKMGYALTDFVHPATRG